MAFLVEKGSFAKRVSVGTDVIAHSLAESPDILIFWATKQTATGFSTDYIYSIGYSDSTRHKAVSMVSEDAQTMSDTSKKFSDLKCIHLFTPNGATASEADISAVSSTNFTVNWTTSDVASDIIHYMIFAGSDITTFEVGQFAANIVTGNQVVPHTNAPSGGYDIYMFLSVNNSVTTITNTGCIGVGFATGPANEAAMFVNSENNRGTSDTFRFQREDRCIVQLVGGTGAIDAEAEFVSKQAADFTINWVDAPASADLMAFMGIKGGQHHVNNFTEPGSTGTQDITDAGFQTNGYMLASYCRNAQTTVQTINKISFGGTDGTIEGILSARDADAVGTMEADTNESTADVFRIIADTGDTIIDEANHSALLSNGFQINWTNIGEAAEIFYWAFGNAAAPPARRRFPQKPINLRY